MSERAPADAGLESMQQHAVAVLEGTSQRGRLGRLLPFLGPAFIASVAYMDPGNFATNIQGGAQFGYLLLWVIVASNLMAMLVQTLSAKLGIATGLNLPEMIRQEFPRPLVWAMWVLAEVVAMATDLAEFLGAAVGFNLLFGIPLLPAGILTAVVTFAILALQRYGFRPLEAVITAFVGVIGLCYLIETILGHPDFGAAGQAVVHPRFAGTESVLLAAGILGATVMPHVIYLHSALTQNRIVAHTPGMKQRIFRFELIDILIAMGIAGLVNTAMLMMAAATFWANGIEVTADSDIIKQAFLTLTPLLGRRGQHRLRHLAARLRALLVDGRHDGRPGDHAGLHPPPDPDLAAPTGDDAAGADRHRLRHRRHPRPGPQSGRALLRHSVCPGAAGALHAPARSDGRPRQSPADDRRGRRWWQR